jgi:DNA polymerase delta subunit 3
MKAGAKLEPPPVASSSNVRANVSSQLPSNGKEKGEGKEGEAMKAQESLKSKEKPKATGKLDFGKAKTKAMKKEEANESVEEPKQKIIEGSKSNVKSERVAEKKKSSKDLKVGIYYILSYIVAKI